MLNNTITKMYAVSGDTDYQLNFTCQDADGNAVDLTNASLTFSAQLDSDGDVQFSNSMVIDTAASGTCHYLSTSTDFPVAGTYNAQITALYSGSGQKITFDGIEIVVSARIPV